LALTIRERAGQKANPRERLLKFATLTACLEGGTVELVHAEPRIEREHVIAELDFIRCERHACFGKRPGLHEGWNGIEDVENEVLLESCAEQRRQPHYDTVVVLENVQLEFASISAIGFGGFEARITLGIAGCGIGEDGNGRYQHDAVRL